MRRTGEAAMDTAKRMIQRKSVSRSQCRRVQKSLRTFRNHGRISDDRRKVNEEAGNIAAGALVSGDARRYDSART
jgi:hypothetical protein